MMMNNSPKEKITFRVSKQLLDEIDTFVKTSDNHECRSDFLREIITKNKSTIITLQDAGLLVHSKTFKEIIKQLQPENLQTVTKKTASIIHSILQNKTKTSLNNIRDMEVLSFISELYQTTNMVKKLNYRIENDKVIMCISGENLNNTTYTQFIQMEITNVMKPWFEKTNHSETPGNLILTFKINNTENTIRQEIKKFFE